MVEALIFVVFPFCMVFAAVSDMLSMTIANRVSLLLLGGFVAIAPLTGMGPVEIGWHLLGGATVLAVTFTLFALGTMGGGDAKLMAATAVWMGFDLLLLQYLVFAAAIGGLLTLGILSFRSSLFAPITKTNLFLRHLADEKTGVPYGIALGIGGLMTYPQSPLMVWAVGRLIA